MWGFTADGSPVSLATWREVREHSGLSIRPESRAEEGGIAEEEEMSVNGGGVRRDISVGVVKKKKKRKKKRAQRPVCASVILNPILPHTNTLTAHL